MKQRVIFLTMGLSLAASGLVESHEVSSATIRRLSQNIEAHPASARLYLNRGIAFEDKGAYDHAEADFIKARRLDPALAEAQLWLGKIYLAQKAYRRAAGAFSRYLHRNPDDQEARVGRALAYGQLGRHERALADVQHAIRHGRQPEPAFYLQRAELQRARPNVNLKEVLAGLDDGLKRLGPVVDLLKKSIEVATRLDLPEDTLKPRFDLFVKAAPFDGQKAKGDWLLHRGYLKEARGEYVALITRIERLPVRRRTLPHFQKLKEDANRCFHETLQKPPAPSGSPGS